MRTYGLALAVLLGAVVGGCGTDSPDDQPAVRAAAVYESIVRWLAAADESDPEPLPLFIEPRGEGTEIALEVQAEVIAAAQDVADIRFVDSRSEAFVDDETDLPVVADGGALVRLGPVNDTTRVVGVDVDVYDDRVDAEGEPQFITLEFWLVSASGRWTVSGTPEVMPPR